MIVRVSEARVRPGLQGEFLERLKELVADFPARAPGLLDHEILVDIDDESRVLYVTTWSDADAIEDYAGRGWRDTPVTFPDEGALLTGPLTLRHFVRPDAPWQGA